MFRNILSSAEGINIYALVVLVLFFTIFIMIFLRAVTAKKGFIEKMSNLPLEDDDAVKGTQTH